MATVRKRDERCAPKVGAAQQRIPWVAVVSVLALFGCLDRSVEVAGSSNTTTVSSIQITPPAATVSPGDQVQFHARGVTRAGDSIAVQVVWTARYGMITPDGLYTAPATGEQDVITARAAGTAYQDSAVVSLVALPVGAVNVTPANANLYVGDVTKLSAVVLNTRGDTLLGRILSWSSSDSTIAAVNESGVVTGVGQGNATVAAATAGKQGTSSLAVLPPPQPGVWPHEPPSYALIAEQPWSVLSSLGWFLEFGTASIGVDATAPESPPLVLQITYPTGFAGGSAPGTMTYPLSNVHQLFSGMWWKFSSPWQGQNAGSNKIQYAFTDHNGSITMVMYGPVNGPWELRVFPQFSVSPLTWLTPNVSHVAVQAGVWHCLEWLLVWSSNDTTADGVVRWWMDGQLIGDYENVVFPNDAFNAYKVAPVWGGVGDVKQETDYYWFDQVHLSGH